MDLDHLTAFVESLAREAGRISLRYFRKPLRSKLKPGNQGMVSEADFESERFIIDKIHNTYPEHHVLAEESAPDFLKQFADGWLWVIDPIDGTTNFVQGNVYYCISIALYEVKNSKAQPIIGCVHQPASGDLYLAVTGRGARLNGEVLKMKDSLVPQQGSFGTGFSYNSNENLNKVFLAIRKVKEIDPAATVRVNGAAALDISRTAQGVLSGFWEFNLSPWDMAAGNLIIREAGGKVSNFKGEDFDLFRDRDIICGPPLAHKLLVDNITSVFT